VPAYVPDAEDPPFDIEDPDEGVGQPEISSVDLIKRELGGEIIDDSGNG
jgi:hypothetical protein